MWAAIQHCDDLLRGTARFRVGATSQRPWWWVVAIILVVAPLYGGIMGSFGLDSAERLRQVVFSGVKAPLLLLATTAVCLPGFFVLNTVLGLRDDLREALQAILCGQAGLSIALASLGPVTRFWYFSTGSYRGALLFNAAVFAIAALAGQIVISRYYRPLIARRRRHRIALYTWFALYAFVGIQMAWMLRPFVGSPYMRPTFFRQEPFSNAYVVIFNLVTGA